MERKFVISFAIVATIATLAFIAMTAWSVEDISNYKNTIYLNDSLYNTKIDSLNKIIIQDEELIEYYKKGIDNYIIIVDSLNEELLLSNVKLERIKEYNRIAGQGNNITFLRGWINRVLSE